MNEVEPAKLNIRIGNVLCKIVYVLVQYRHQKLLTIQPVKRKLMRWGRVALFNTGFWDLYRSFIGDRWLCSIRVFGTGNVALLGTGGFVQYGFMGLVT